MVIYSIHTEAIELSLMAVAVAVFTIRKAAIRFHRYFKFKVYRLSSVPSWWTVNCAALRRAELVVIIYNLLMKAASSVLD